MWRREMSCPELPYHLEILSPLAIICVWGCPFSSTVQLVDIPAAYILSSCDNSSSSECLLRLEVHSACNYHTLPFFFDLHCCWSRSSSPAFTHCDRLRTSAVCYVTDLHVTTLRVSKSCSNTSTYLHISTSLPKCWKQLLKYLQKAMM